MVSQEPSRVIRRLFGSLQGKVGWKDVGHRLPNVDLRKSAGRIDSLRDAMGVVEENLVLANMKKDGRHCIEIAI
jgi:hypothetical protein